MPFKQDRLFTGLLIVTATYVAYLGFQQQLNLYIHPRYIIFTVVMTTLGLGLLILNSYFTESSKKTNKTKNPTDHTHTASPLSYLPLIVILLAALVLPARTLTSATVSQRTLDSGSIIATTDDRPLSTLFAGSSRGLKMSDWSRLLASNTDAAYYANKPAKISGFVYDAGLGNDIVWLARFVVSCCAVDAQPIGIPVQLKNWPTGYDSDEWVAVEGIFQKVLTVEGEQLVLVPDSIKKIEQPSDPYAN